MSALLPLSKNQSAHDGDEDEERSQLEGIDKSGEEHGREIRSVSESVRARCVWNRTAVMNHGGGKKPSEGKSERQSSKFGEFLKIGMLFYAGIQKHDHKNEKDHDCSAINDDLHGGDEFRAQQEIEAGKRNQDKEYDKRCAHRLLRKSTNPAVTMTLAIETGSRSFQPMFMSWS